MRDVENRMRPPAWVPLRISPCRIGVKLSLSHGFLMVPKSSWGGKSLYIPEPHPLLPDAVSRAPRGSTKVWIASGPENARPMGGSLQRSAAHMAMGGHNMRPAHKGKWRLALSWASTYADQISGSLQGIIWGRLFGRGESNEPKRQPPCSERLLFTRVCAKYSRLCIVTSKI